MFPPTRSRMPGERRLKNSEPVYVLDATPIIHFAKVNRLTMALSICQAYITREVYKETVERGEGKPDALLIHDAIESGVLKLYDVRNRTSLAKFLRHTEIHLGEAETLAAAKELDAFAIIDEAEARALAKTYGVKYRTGTLFLLFRLLALGKVNVNDCETVLDKLVQSGLYLDSTTLINAKNKIRSHVGKGK